MRARRRLARLETQLVGGIQTLSSGVRAGLNLVQSMELVARLVDGEIGTGVANHATSRAQFGRSRCVRPSTSPGRRDEGVIDLSPVARTSGGLEM